MPVKLDDNIPPEKIRGYGYCRSQNLQPSNFFKWWQKLLSNNSKPWSMLIKSRYYQNQPMTLKTLGQQQLSSFWKQAHLVRGLFQALIKFNVGNGQGTSSWNDTRLNDHSIQELFPCFYTLSVNHDITIAEAFKPCISSEHWPLSMPLNIHPKISKFRQRAWYL